MFPAEVLDAAGDASIDNGGEYTPDFWLLASLESASLESVSFLLASFFSASFFFI